MYFFALCRYARFFCFRICQPNTRFQPRPQGLLAFQYGGGSGEDPGTQQNHVTKISNEDGNVFKMAAKAK